ncbi:MAG TPA: exosortase [Planctomycetaceae bacterium]|nr:exosortase [Planctomycetaceae bacterium]
MTSKKKPHKRRGKLKATRKASLTSEAPAAVNSPAPLALPEPLPAAASRSKLIAAALLGVTFIWAYWPTFGRLIGDWNREPDYSHGFLVPPLALFFLYARRDRFPGLTPAVGWFGLLLIAGSVAMRFFGTLAFVDAIDSWSMILWIAGAAWMLGGYRFALWTAPSIAFLFFMVPLPFRAETMLSGPLQTAATKISCFMLQFIGQPAISEGRTILLGDHQLEVEQACSGLRIFVGICALAFSAVVLMRRTWWEKTLFLLSTLPIALLANSLRIVATGLLFQHASGEAARKFSHDFSGWVMIPVAAAMFWLFAWYLHKLFPKLQQVRLQSVATEDSSQMGVQQASA